MFYLLYNLKSGCPQFVCMALRPFPVCGGNIFRFGGEAV